MQRFLELPDNRIFKAVNSELVKFRKVSAAYYEIKLQPQNDNRVHTISLQLSVLISSIVIYPTRDRTKTGSECVDTYICKKLFQ